MNSIFKIIGELTNDETVVAEINNIIKKLRKRYNDNIPYYDYQDYKRYQKRHEYDDAYMINFIPYLFKTEGEYDELENIIEDKCNIDWCECKDDYRFMLYCHEEEGRKITNEQITAFIAANIFHNDMLNGARDSYDGYVYFYPTEEYLEEEEVKDELYKSFEYDLTKNSDTDLIYLENYTSYDGNHSCDFTIEEAEYIFKNCTGESLYNYWKYDEDTKTLELKQE